MTAFDLGRILWAARIRHAWGAHADTIMARDPWPKHRSDPAMGTAHELAIAEAHALLVHYDVTEKA